MEKNKNNLKLDDFEIKNGVLKKYKGKEAVVVIPDSVTKIGEYAFRDCKELTSVTIPSSVTTIGEGAFGCCSNLTSILVDKENTYYHVKGNSLIETETKTLIAGCKNSIIPDDGSVTTIGESAFEDCTGLTSVTIPNSVTTIVDSAFNGCSNLATILVNKGNPKYHSNGNCLIETKTKTLIAGCMNSIIPDDGSVTTIGEYAFRGCTGLTSVTIPNSVTTIEGKAFWGCEGLTSVTIPNSVTEIGEGAFYGCEGLTSVTIPSSVTTIGDLAFCDCTELTSVTIPSSVTKIGKGAFYRCSNFTSLIVDKGNPQYHSDGNCIIETKTKTLIAGCMNSTIPDDGSVTTIEEYAFQGCTGLTSVTIPDSVTEIGDSAFEDCTGLTSVTIPNSVTTIGEHAFCGCTRLTSVTIPNSVTKIWGRAFGDCSGLTSVTIPNSVTKIDFMSFDGCENLKTVYFQGTEEQWEKIQGFGKDEIRDKVVFI